MLKDLDFADEIIVIDSYSTDKTIEIITAFKNVKLIQNPFENYTSQRNFALDNATHESVLFLDADEKLTQSLKTEIIETIQLPNTATAYLVYRTFIFKNTKLRFSG